MLKLTTEEGSIVYLAPEQIAIVQLGKYGSIVTTAFGKELFVKEQAKDIVRFKETHRLA